MWLIKAPLAQVYQALNFEAEPYTSDDLSAADVAEWFRVVKAVPAVSCLWSSIFFKLITNLNNKQSL